MISQLIVYNLSSGFVYSSRRQLSIFIPSVILAVYVSILQLTISVVRVSTGFGSVVIVNDCVVIEAVVSELSVFFAVVIGPAVPVVRVYMMIVLAVSLSIDVVDLFV